MFGLPKCPHCKQNIDRADLKDMILGNQLSGPLYYGYASVCPKCQTIISTHMNPDTQRQQLMDEILAALGIKKK
jgi:phage FluMu protein Com